MKYLLSIVFIFGIAVFFLATPDAALAQNFVRCSGVGTDSCDFCDLVDMANRIIKWLIGILVTLAVLLMAVAGVKLVVSGGDQGALRNAKDMLQNAIIGFIIVLSAWVIVDTVMKSLVGDQGLGRPWNDIECGINIQPQEPVWEGDPDADEGGVGDVAGEPSEEQPPGSYIPSTGNLTPCTLSGGCTQLTVPCKEGASCQVSSDLAPRINAFHAAVAGAGVTGTRVTEGWPPAGYSEADPTGIHVSACHGVGTCIDYGRAGGLTASEVNTVANAARANNLRPVYEVKTAGERNALVDAGADPANIKVIPAITAPHFSIYGY